MIVLFERSVSFVPARCLLVTLVARRVRDAAMLQTVEIEAVRFSDNTRFNGSPHEILKGVVEASLR